jgi:hypothetical protein
MRAAWHARSPRTPARTHAHGTVGPPSHLAAAAGRVNAEHTAHRRAPGHRRTRDERQHPRRRPRARPAVPRVAGAASRAPERLLGPLRRHRLAVQLEH